MCRVGIVILCAVLCGCAVWDAGDDPHGRTFKEATETVVQALQNYRQQNGHYPERLQELVPKYLTQLPDVPQLGFDPKTGNLSFNYLPNWPQMGATTCSTNVEDLKWKCFLYM